MKTISAVSFGGATPRERPSEPVPAPRRSGDTAAERALVSKVQRLLKQSQARVAAMAALDRERARLSADLDRTQAEVSAVLAELAKMRPPDAPRM